MTGSFADDDCMVYFIDRNDFVIETLILFPVILATAELHFLSFFARRMFVEGGGGCTDSMLWADWRHDNEAERFVIRACKDKVYRALTVMHP